MVLWLFPHRANCFKMMLNPNCIVFVDQFRGFTIIYCNRIMVFLFLRLLKLQIWLSGVRHFYHFYGVLCKIKKKNKKKRVHRQTTSLECKGSMQEQEKNGHWLILWMTTDYKKLKIASNMHLWFRVPIHSSFPFFLLLLFEQQIAALFTFTMTSVKATDELYPQD